MIPAARYPDAIDVRADGRHLAIATLMGRGSGWRGEPKRRHVHDNRGSVAVVPVPAPEQLATYTTVVAENNRAALLRQRTAAAGPKPAPLPVPLRTGDPSQIGHVRMPAHRTSLIVNGKRNIAADTASRLGRYFGMSAQYWLNIHAEASGLICHQCCAA